MRPAVSLLLFTVLSGLGFGTLAAAGLGLAGGWVWPLGYGFALAGLLASTFHLAHPMRALYAFRNGRHSWLSREGWAAVLTLLLLAPVALADLAGSPGLRGPGWGVPGALMAAVTVGSTSMIYAQLRSVPRWSHWSTPALFLAFAATGGAILAAPGAAAALVALGLSGLLGWSIRTADRREAALGIDTGWATGLGHLGRVRSFERPVTGTTWLTREVAGDPPAPRWRRLLRLAAVLLSGAVPAALLLGGAPRGVALAVHLAGAFTARWLFFAEAGHVAALHHGLPFGAARLTGGAAARAQ